MSRWQCKTTCYGSPTKEGKHRKWDAGIVYPEITEFETDLVEHFVDLEAETEAEDVDLMSFTKEQLIAAPLKASDLIQKAKEFGSDLETEDRKKEEIIEDFINLRDEFLSRNPNSK